MKKFITVTILALTFAAGVGAASAQNLSETPIKPAGQCTEACEATAAAQCGSCAAIPSCKLGNSCVVRCDCSV